MYEREGQDFLCPVAIVDNCVKTRSFPTIIILTHSSIHTKMKEKIPPFSMIQTLHFMFKQKVRSESSQPIVLTSSSVARCCYCMATIR